MTGTRRSIAGRSVRWDEERARSAYAQGHWVRATLADALARAAADAPERVLIIDGEVRLSARDLQQNATALAQVLAQRFPRGSVISFMLPNWHEAAVIYLATTLAGMVAHPVLPSMREYDLRFMLQDVGSCMIFIPEEFRGHQCAQMLQAVVAQLAAPPDVVVVRGDCGPHLAYGALFHAITPCPLPTLEPDAVRMIMYTSGTTGSPKGVMHSHNSLHALIQQLGTAPNTCCTVAMPLRAGRGSC